MKNINVRAVKAALKKSERGFGFCDPIAGGHRLKLGSTLMVAEDRFAKSKEGKRLHKAVGNWMTASMTDKKRLAYWDAQEKFVEKNLPKIQVKCVKQMEKWVAAQKFPFDVVVDVRGHEAHICLLIPFCKGCTMTRVWNSSITYMLASGK